MRKAKRVLAVLLLLVIAFSIFAGATQAQNDQISKEPPKEDKGGLFEWIIAGIVSIPANIVEGIAQWWGHFKAIIF